MPIEQVYFTWAKSGLRGYGMYQPVAQSTGFNLLPAGAQDLALKLCRYSRPSTMVDHPESFGWIDSAGSRFAFYRSLLPALQTGKPGNFAAHVIVGPARELSISDVLESFQSGSWWRGPLSDDENTNPALQPFEFDGHHHDGFERSNGASAVGIGLLGQMLRGHSRLRFPAVPSEAVEALRHIARTMPSILDGLSFSTFEHGDSENWFSILGNATQYLTDREDSEARTAAAYILSRSVRAKSLGAIDPSAEGRKRSLDRLTALASIIGRVNDGSDLTTDDLVARLSSRDTIGDVLDYASVRHLVAAKLVEGDASVWAVLKINAYHVDPDPLGALGESIAMVLGEHLPTPALMRQLATLPAPITDGLALSFLAPPRLFLAGLLDWPPELVRAVCRLDRSGIDEGVQAALSSAFIGKGGTEWLGDRRVPSRLRAGLAKHLIETNPASPADSFLAESDVIRYLFHNEPSSLRMASRSMTSPAKQTAACFVILHIQSVALRLHSEHALILDDLIGELPLSEQVEAWTLIHTAVGRLPEEINHAAEQCVGRYLSRMVMDHQLPFSEEVVQLIRAVPTCRRWAALIRSAPTGHMRSVQTALEAFTEAEYELASLVAFDVLAVTAPRTREGTSTGYSLVSAGGVPHLSRARRYVRAGFRHAVHAQRPDVLVWAFQQILQFGDFQPPRADRIRGLMSKDPGKADAESLLAEAGCALKWLASAAPEDARTLMDSAPNIYERSTVRWLLKVAKATGVRSWQT